MVADILAIRDFFSIYSETRSHILKAREDISQINELKMQWASAVMTALNVKWQTFGQPTPERATIFVGNHVSYLDIPILLASAPGLSFVAKKEIMRWPFFGEAAQLIETVFVKRERKKSRRLARQAIQDAVQAGGRVVIFPSGTTTLYEDVPWRRGAFEIAAELGCAVQPFRIHYSPLREAAYINRDFLPFHLYSVAKAKRIRAQIEYGEVFHVQDSLEECERIQRWTQEPSPRPFSFF